MTDSTLQKPVSIEQAKSLDGLRVLLYQGLPSPWSQATKGVFKNRNISYTSVVKSDNESDEEILEWTGQQSYPAVVYNDEKPCSSWLEILFLAERLGDGPSLVPQDSKQRALMSGMSHEVFGQMGFCWNRRLMLFDRTLSSSKIDSDIRAYIEVLAARYRYNKQDASNARQRVIDVLNMLSQQLENQKQRGSFYLIGDQLTALDIYWATSAMFLRPLPEDQCPLPPGLRETYELKAEDIGMTIDERLLEHRDRVYQTHLGLPVITSCG